MFTKNNTGRHYSKQLSLKDLLMAVLLGSSITATAQLQTSLKNDRIQLEWKKDAKGWKINRLAVKQNNAWKVQPNPSGEYTILFSAAKPDTTPVKMYNNAGNEIQFPEPQYRYIVPVWREALQPAEMNTAGEALYFYPSTIEQIPGNAWEFRAENDKAAMVATWQFDHQYPSDIIVTIVLRAKQSGYYSIATPTLNTIDTSSLAWATVPGVFQGNAINHNFVNAFAYGQGIPAKPVVARERTASTLSPLVSTTNNITTAVIPAPGTGRDPWEKNKKTQTDWQLGLSVMNRKGALSPTAYHPVLGEKGSYVQQGNSIQFSFRYSIQSADWYTMLKHAARDIYRLHDFLALKQTRQSLTNRMLAMHRYVINDSTSKWRVEDYKGNKIGAQMYLGGVYGASGDAIKNADYGAMWMLANIMHDTVLASTRLPFARNFKIAQQADSGFFKGAAAGQYYLTQHKRFTEEWGPYSEPIGSTYYMLMDMGNVLLFEQKDTTLTKALRTAADKLAAWMSPEGQWVVAYDNASNKPIFTDVEDLRPTFYGLVIAYKLLGDEKYLTAAKKGANWYIQHAVNKGSFLGVCGDSRFAPDFATGQSVQALLDLYDITRDQRYRNAALTAAKIYTASIYTHPIPTAANKTVNGVQRKDWEISQVGLSFEHGGVIGSANHRGPILLASHAGMFVRLFALTKDSLFLDMARAAALGRNAFVDTTTGVASYYWDVMNKGAGPYPHHAWWQIGWITDYLLSEMNMRSNGNISFPQGFITPKVGPHKTYGFKEGNIFGTKASLLLQEGLITIDNPYTDYFCAINTVEKKLFVLLLNDDNDPQTSSIKIDYNQLAQKQTIQPSTVNVLNEAGKKQKVPVDTTLTINMQGYGLRVIEVNY